MKKPLNNMEEKENTFTLETYDNYVYCYYCGKAENIQTAINKQWVKGPVESTFICNRCLN